MTTVQSWTEEQFEVAGAKTQLFKGGNGEPLLALHGAAGNRGWMPYHQSLSEHYTVYVPSHPGYNDSERPQWVSTITDVAHFYLGLIRNLNLGSQIRLMGFSMGGWIAAEIAAMAPHIVKGMVLVDAVGIKPRVGEIAEVLMVSPKTVQEIGYYDISLAPNLGDLSEDEQAVQWRNREMASRLCWKPYMHNPKLPDYLKLIQVPSLMIWGRQDGIVPLDCGEIYHEVLEGSSLHIIDQCGHSPQTEKPQELVDATLGFFSKL